MNVLNSNVFSFLSDGNSTLHTTKSFFNVLKANTDILSPYLSLHSSEDDEERGKEGEKKGNTT